MGSTLDRRIAKLPAKRRAKVNARADELISEEMSLQDLRKAMDRTQVEIAKELDVGQDTVSRYEQRTDMLLSTLRSYVRAMGGELDLVARFPNRGPVSIKALRDLANEPRKRKTG
jgi:transcriptional regulator with XRE-family HTH domain